MKKFDLSKQSARIFVVLIALIIMGVGFFGGVWYGYTHQPAVDKVLNVSGKEPPSNLQNVDFNLFWDVWSRLESQYVDKGKVNRQDMVYGAISGLVNSLKDPYSVFLPPALNKEFQEDTKGSFEGIGAEIGVRKGFLVVISPLKGMPADKAGLKPGDKILKIDDTVASDLSLDEAVRLIRGPKGTSVKLTISRDSLDKTKVYEITRDTIKVEVLTTETKPDGIFVIKLNQFTENAGVEFRKAVQEFYSSNSKKLVFDLRNNPGGYLTVSVDIASWFLPPGETVVHERFASGEENLYRSAGYRLLDSVPTVVLVNEGSASASEIVAGALRDVRGIKLIGTKTFGKGSVQEVEPLPGNASLKLTVAKWLTPKGNEINGKGLEPDIKVEFKEENLKPGEDPIMDKGIEVLKSL